MIPDERTRSPVRFVASFVIFQLVVLTAVPTLLSTSPPLDVVEGWIWAPHWLLGTYKHPPMPAWFIQMAHWVLPGYIFPPYLLSQCAVGLTYLLVYRIGRLYMAEAEAAAGTMLLAGSYYFTLPTLEFNHNVLQMPVWAGIILVFAHIVKQPGRTSHWLLLGLLVGAGMYVKYSIAVLALVVAATGVVLPAVRARFVTPQPYLAVGMALLVFAPHGAWLVSNDFLPLAYAADRSAQASSSLFQPLGAMFVQIADHLPMLLLLLASGVSSLRYAARQAFAPADARLLSIFTFVPALLVTVVAIASGSGLKDMWGMPMFTVAGLWLVALIGRAWGEDSIRRLWLGAMAVVALIAVVVVAQALLSWVRKPSRAFWPMVELATKADALWASEVGSPLRITGGSDWLAGLVSIGSPHHPVVVTANSLHTAPWVKEDDIRRYGMLYLVAVPQPTLPDFCIPRGPVHSISFAKSTVPTVYAVICPPQIPR